MKIDVDFIKQIFLKIEENTDYVVSSHALMKNLNIKNKDLERKFMGHILLLGDEGFLESFSAKYPFGFVNCVGGEYSIMDVGYRLTAKGYAMLDFYNDPYIYNKVKTYSISNAYDIAKSIMLKK